MKVGFFGAISWLAFVGLYLLMTGKADVSEIIAGAAAASMALYLVGLLRRKFKKPLFIKPGWIVLLWRIPIAMITESFQLLFALFSRLFGREVEGRFIDHEHPAPADEHDSARRAFMTFGVCITPNSYLVYYDREKRRVLIRQLVGEKLSKVDELFVELP